MAKERLHELKETANSFQIRGVVVGTKGDKFYKSGIGRNGGMWNSAEFGVKIANDKVVYVKLNGFPRDEVFYYKKGENGAKGDTQRVKWANRHKSPGADYRLIGVNISIGKDDKGGNINQTFTEYDAVEWLHENLSDGDSVLIRGKMVFSSYVDREGEVRRKIEFVPNQISATWEPIDLDAEDHKEMAEFTNTIVFSSIDRETGVDGKATGRAVLSGYSVGYNSVENVSFIIDADHPKVAAAIKKRMRPGNAIKTFGRIEIQNSVEPVVVEDDGWGSTEVSPLEEKKVTAPSIREYIVYKVDGNTFDTDTYSEAKIEEALRKVRAAQVAAKNFGEKPGVVNVTANDGWNDDDDDDVSWDV